ncbi:2-oxoglutarate-Fe(II) type oxidoreductase hxnY-like protein [Drosera capensis]
MLNRLLIDVYLGQDRVGSYLKCELSGDYTEGYYIAVEVPADDPKAEQPFCGPNVWPAAGLCRCCVFVYGIALKTSTCEVGRKVARIIALALDLDVDFFDKMETLGDPIASLRLLHYNGQVSDPSEGLFGAGAHSDFGLITLLATDDVLALQMCKDKDAKPQKWEYVAPLKGTFIANLGEISTLHRVIGSGQDRYSIAFFVEPNGDCIVHCFPSCESESNPPRYPPISGMSYMSKRYKETHNLISFEQH